jgi:uncharacterized protein (TIGR03083 family)
VLGRAFTRRVPADTGVEPTAVNRAYVAQNDELDTLLSGLAPADWGAPTITGFTVHELVGHLIGVSLHLGSLLGLQEFEVAGRGHHEMTMPVVEHERERPPGDTLERWRAQAKLLSAPVLALTDADLDRRVDFHGIDLSLRSVIGAYVFETWTHSDDVRRALGRPLEAPGPGRMRSLCDQAVAALPLGLLIAGIDREDDAITVVLTGPGGGTWHQSLRRGEPDPTDPPATVLVADAADFCRLAAQRLAPEAIPHHVRGDEDLVRDVLLGAQVFAA